MQLLVILQSHIFQQDPSPQYRSLLTHLRRLVTHIYSSITSTTSRSPNQIIINEPQLEVPLSPSPPLPIQAPRPSHDDPDLKSTWSHRAWVASGSTAMLVSLLKSITLSAQEGLLLEPILAGLLGYYLADLTTGIYHWAIDNYGDSSTPIFGSQIEAFQGHHKFPWTITKRQFSNNLHALARAITILILPINILNNEPVLNAFVCVFSGCIMFSQQFHAWAHGPKSKLPPLVLCLQDAGVIVSRVQHGAHHRAPYNSNYCIVSGAWNRLLDKQSFFEALEMVVYNKFGVRPRSWDEPNSEWTEASSGTSNP